MAHSHNNNKNDNHSRNEPNKNESNSNNQKQRKFLETESKPQVVVEQQQAFSTTVQQHEPTIDEKEDHLPPCSKVNRKLIHRHKSDDEESFFHESITCQASSSRNGSTRADDINNGHSCSHEDDMIGSSPLNGFRDIQSSYDAEKSTAVSDADKTLENSSDPMPLVRSLLIIIALSFHSIFDGLAIGLQSTSNQVWQLFLAISLHKLLIAFVVGLDVFAETMSVKRVALYMLPFSVVSPIGVLVAGLTKSSISDNISGVLSAVATGSLLYITFFEILMEQRYSKKISGLLQFVMVVFGFSAMALLQLLDAD